MGKGKHSTDTRGEQKGAQQHGEGQYGPKAYEAKRAEIADHSRTHGESGRDAADPNNDGKRHGEAELHERMIANPEFERDGHHRLFENRTQHDEAERGSERTRRDRDVQRHDHDPEKFQGLGPNGGGEAESRRADTTILNAGKGGGQT